MSELPSDPQAPSFPPPAPRRSRKAVCHGKIIVESGEWCITDLSRNAGSRVGITIHNDTGSAQGFEVWIRQKAARGRGK